VTLDLRTNDEDGIVRKSDKNQIEKRRQQWQQRQKEKKQREQREIEDTSLHGGLLASLRR